MIDMPLAENSAGRRAGPSRPVRCLAVVDATEATNRVVDFAVALVQGRADSEVIVLNVQQRSNNPRLRGYDNFMQKDVEARLIEDRGRPIVDTASGWLQKAGIRALSKVQVGEPLPLILQAAAEGNCDAIVIGIARQPDGALGWIFNALGLWFGSSLVPQLIERSPVPVVVVK